MFFGLALTLAIPSGFGRSRIRRNCGYTLCLLHKLAKKSVMIIVDRRIDRNFSYARKKVLSGKAFQPVPAQ